MNYLKTTIFVGCALMLPVSAIAQTPIFDAIEARTAEKISKEKTQQCLLSSRVIDYAANNTDLIDTDNKRAVRAADAAPKLEISYRSNMQTDMLFNKGMNEVKAEYDHFKSADEKEQKRLFKVAKGINKECWKKFDSAQLHRMGRTDRIAKLIPPMSSEKADLCGAAAIKSMTDYRDFTATLERAVVWNTVEIAAIRREGHPPDQLVDLNADEDKPSAFDTLKEMGADRALELRKDCEKKYDEAIFKAKIEEPTEEGYVFNSAINWD